MFPLAPARQVTFSNNRVLLQIAITGSIKKIAYTAGAINGIARKDVLCGTRKRSGNHQLCDIAATANKILKLGFPDFNVRRLWQVLSGGF
jgi:hypothetical protein